MHCAFHIITVRVSSYRTINDNIKIKTLFPERRQQKDSKKNTKGKTLQKGNTVIQGSLDVYAMN